MMTATAILGLFQALTLIGRGLDIMVFMAISTFGGITLAVNTALVVPNYLLLSQGGTIALKLLSVANRPRITHSWDRGASGGDTEDIFVTARRFFLNRWICNCLVAIADQDTELMPMVSDSFPQSETSAPIS